MNTESNKKEISGIVDWRSDTKVSESSASILRPKYFRTIFFFKLSKF